MILKLKSGDVYDTELHPTLQNLSKEGIKEMLDKYKAKPGDEGYLDAAGRKRYLIYASVCSILIIVVWYFFMNTL